MRCDLRTMKNRKEGRASMATMQSVVIPLTVPAFKLYTGQMKYCNDTQLIKSELAYMRGYIVIPTAFTYGLNFGACFLK